MVIVTGLERILSRRRGRGKERRGRARSKWQLSMRSTLCTYSQVRIFECARLVYVV